MSVSKERCRAAVYRLYDEAGELLYIGSAYDPKRRSKAHRSKDWWLRVTRCEVEWHSDRQAAFKAETDAIEAEGPTFNRISGPGPVALPIGLARTTSPVIELEEVEAYFEMLRREQPEIRARRLTELLVVVKEAVLPKRRDALLELKESGMTYRQIAAVTGLSFSRVRQILADDRPPASAA